MGVLERRQFLRLSAVGAAAALAARFPASETVVSPATAQTSSDLDWSQEWQDTLAAARGEGKLSLLTWVGSGYRRMVEAFQQSFPGITVDHLAESSASVWLNRVRQERR